MAINRMLAAGLITGTLTLGSTVTALHLDKERKQNPNYVAARQLENVEAYLTRGQEHLTFQDEYIIDNIDSPLEDARHIISFPNANEAKKQLQNAYILAKGVANCSNANQELARQTSQTNAGLAKLIDKLVPARIEQTEEPIYATHVASLDNTIDTINGLANKFKLQAPIDRILAFEILALLSASATAASLSAYAISGRRREEESPNQFLDALYADQPVLTETTGRYTL